MSGPVDRSEMLFLVYVSGGEKYVLQWHPGDEDAAINASGVWRDDPELAFNEDQAEEVMTRINELRR